MKPIWINKVREKQDKSGGIVPPPEIPSLLPLDKDGRSFSANLPKGRFFCPGAKKLVDKGA